MPYEWQDQMDMYLTAEGVNWKPYIEDWKTFAGYGPNERNYTPAGIINHHTASTAWYPKEKLTTKCNLYIDPDGVVWIMSAGYQFDSGDGDRLVLQAILHDQVPPQPMDTATNGLRMLGNQWFIDIEVGHPGDGSPIPAVQRESLIKTNVALLRMHGWSPYINLIDHKWWTRRKVDVRWSWNGKIDKMTDIQNDVAAALAQPSQAPNLDECLPHQVEAWKKAWTKGLINEDTHPQAVMSKGDYFVFEDRAGNLD